MEIVRTHASLLQTARANSCLQSSHSIVPRGYVITVGGSLHGGGIRGVHKASCLRMGSRRSEIGMQVSGEAGHMRGQFGVEGSLVASDAMTISDVGVLGRRVRRHLRQLTAHEGGVGRARVGEVRWHSSPLGRRGKGSDEGLLRNDAGSR